VRHSIRGRLIECEFHPRDVRNQLLLTGYHKRINRIRLDNAYLMCGKLCQAYFRRENDTAKDRGVIHRIYADDLESSDELIDCVFAIWRKGKVVRIFRARSMVRSSSRSSRTSSVD
jgi:phosphatidylserine/phosphatidylglycerophosphate/cardiolipin synthase-like enzyme